MNRFENIKILTIKVIGKYNYELLDVKSRHDTIVICIEARSKQNREQIKFLKERAHELKETTGEHRVLLNCNKKTSFNAIECDKSD